MIGVTLKKTGKKKIGETEIKLVNGKTKRLDIRLNHYTIDIEDYISPERIAILDAINRKYQNYLESESVKKVDWESDNKPKIDEIRTVSELEEIYTRVLATRELISCNGDWGTFQQHFAEMDESTKKQVFQQLSFQERKILKSLKPLDKEEIKAKELIDIIKSGKDVQFRCDRALQGVQNRQNLVHYLHRNYHYLLFSKDKAA